MDEDSTNNPVNPDEGAVAEPPAPAPEPTPPAEGEGAGAPPAAPEGSPETPPAAPEGGGGDVVTG